MRHKKAYRKLGRDTSHRVAMLNNLSKSLLEHGKIDTTLYRAKELTRYFDRIITQGKKNTLHTRRLVFRKIRDESLVKKLFDEIAPSYSERNGGYTRVIKTGTRRGDGAKTARIELV